MTIKSSTKPLLILLLLYVIYGVLDAVFPHDPYSPSIFMLPVGIAMAICLFSWCKRDAEERGISAGVSAMLVGFVALIGLPYYFFRTRSFGRAWLAIGKALLFFIVCSGLYLIALQLTKVLL